MEYFGLKLQTLRKKASMSQDDLASLIGVSRQAISKWERSDGLPDLYNVKKIAEVFNITIDELMDIEIKQIDKKKIKTNKLALAFLTVPGVILGFLSIIALIGFIWGYRVYWGRNYMIDQGGFTILSLFGLVVPVIGVTYMFSLYNLYIGRNVQKHKYIILGLNFTFLFGYTVVLFNIPEYNHIPLIVLLILILAIIVLGIIGGFMYEQERSRNYIDKYAHITKKLRLILKLAYGFVGIVFVTFLSYTLLTHEIVDLNRISYHYEQPDNVGTPIHGYIEVSNDDEVVLIMEGMHLDYTIEKIDQLEVYINNTLIHSSVSIEGFLLNENYNSAYIEIINEQPEQGFLLNYVFEYNFDSMQDFGSSVNISIVLTTGENEYTYEYSNVNYSYGYQNKIVPIWVKEEY